MANLTANNSQHKPLFYSIHDAVECFVYRLNDVCFFPGNGKRATFGDVAEAVANAAAAFLQLISEREGGILREERERLLIKKA